MQGAFKPDESESSKGNDINIQQLFQSRLGLVAQGALQVGNGIYETTVDEVLKLRVFTLFRVTVSLMCIYSIYENY